MWLGDFAGWALQGADGEILAAEARSVMAGRSVPNLLAGLGLAPVARAQSALGERIPSAADLGCAAGNSNAVHELLGVIFRAAAANVAGQSRRYEQARRRAEPDARTLVKVVRAVLDHTETTNAYRAALPWERMPPAVPLDAIERRSGKLRADRVTRCKPGDFFCDRAIGDLVLFLHCCSCGVKLTLVLTRRCSFDSVFRAVRALTASPPRVSAVYGVDPKGESLPPPFIKLVRPLTGPTTASSATAWDGVWAALNAYAVGGCKQARVTGTIEAALQVHEPSTTSVASPWALRWLLDNPWAWTAIVLERYDLVPGVVALFIEKSQLP